MQLLNPNPNTDRTYFRLPKCPNCNEFAFRVLETRNSKLAIRRRSRCDRCKFASTTHEVSEEFFNDAKTNAAILKRIKAVLNIDIDSFNIPAADVTSRCSSCAHNQSNSCSYGLPEYDTPDSFDCNLHECHS
jgi:hypothetical protein